MFRPSRVGVAALVLQLFATPVEAATLTFEIVNADWINVIGGNVTQDTAGNDTANLGWGVTGSSVRSQFQFDGTDTFSPIPTDTLFEIGTFRHTNNPLLGATTGIDSAQLSLTATLTYNDGSSTSVFPGVGLLFFFDHTETPNSCSGAGCSSDLVSVANLSSPISLGGALFTFNLLRFGSDTTPAFNLSTPEEQVRTARLYGSWTVRQNAPPPPPEVPLPPAVIGFASALGATGLASWLRRRFRKN